MLTMRTWCAGSLLLGCASAAGAEPILDVFWVPVAGPGAAPYPSSALADDPELATMQTFDVKVYTSGDWSLAAMRATLPSGSFFYQHTFGGSGTKPNPGIFPAAPSLEFTTYVTSPGDTGANQATHQLGGFPDGEPMSLGSESSAIPGTFSMKWSNITLDAPGTYQIARLTFPAGVFPFTDVDSHTSQANPDTTTSIQQLTHPSANRWLLDADGSWHDVQAWSQQRAPVGNQFAYLDVGGSTIRTITHSQGWTAVHGIVSQEHILLSGGTISTINGLNAAGGITLDGGTLRGLVTGSQVVVGSNGGGLEESSLQSGMLHATDATIVVRDGVRLGGSSSFSSGARLRFDGSNKRLGGSGSVDHAGGVIDVEGSETLTIGDNLLLRKVAGRALRINGSVALEPDVQIDLTDGAIVVDYAGASPLQHLRERIISGYDNGEWDGLGINSSTAAADPSLAVGYAEGSALFTSFPATIAGEEIDATTMILRLVRSGDADLNGTVNLSDFNRLAGNFGSTGALWSDADFNYDGLVNLSDFNLLAGNFGLSATGPDGPTPQDWAALAAAVPEPGVGLVGLSCACISIRRRRTGN